MDVSSAKMMPIYTAINRLEPPANQRVDQGSRVVDTQSAQEAASLTKNQIVQQAGVASMTKADATPQRALDISLIAAPHC